VKQSGGAVYLDASAGATFAIYLPSLAATTPEVGR